MKKIVLQCLATMITFLSFSVSVLATEAPSTPYKTTIQPISVALKARLAKGMGPATDIIVINYTDTPIYLGNPAYLYISGRASARITHPTWGGTTEIQLSNNQGSPWFFDQNIASHARVSVSFANGYVTNIQND